MRRIRIELAYDGTDFHGWQIQPGLPTVQAAVEAVITDIEGRLVHVASSGRTDAGAHALAQVAAVSIENPIPIQNLRKAMNRLLPHSIRIINVRDARPDFHPRYDAVAKTYEYRIFREEVCLPFERRYVHHHPYPLDERAMIDAARLFEGEHDFTAFAATDERDELGLSKVRRIYCSCLERREDRIVYRVRGSGFLKHMVRNIVGVLIEVGKGNLSGADISRRLEPGCTVPAGPTAPPQGLFLIGVEYPEPLPSDAAR
jgi:tRNA pseudouridine38-40 synthase